MLCVQAGRAGQTQGHGVVCTGMAMVSMVAARAAGAHAKYGKYRSSPCARAAGAHAKYGHPRRETPVCPCASRVLQHLMLVPACEAAPADRLVVLTCAACGVMNLSL